MNNKSFNRKSRTRPHAHAQSLAQAAKGASKAGADDFLEEAAIISINSPKLLKVGARTISSLQQSFTEPGTLIDPQ